MNWNVEEMALMNEKSKIYIGNTRIYSCESSTSRADKIAFVDRFHDGRLSYLLSLIEKFAREKATLPKDRYGKVKSTSLIAWIKRNDTKYGQPLLDYDFHYGTISFLGSKRNIQHMQNIGYDFYEDWADECFHRQLVLCEREERKYFEAHDEYCVLKKQVREHMHITTFGLSIADCSDGRMEIIKANPSQPTKVISHEITLNELKELMEKYHQIDALIDKLTKEMYAEGADNE